MAPTHCVVLSTVGNSDALARVIETVRRHQVTILRVYADARDSNWEIELFIRLTSDRHGHLFARLQAIVEVVDVAVWNFNDTAGGVTPAPVAAHDQREPR